MAISVKFEQNIEKRLNHLAQITGRTKTYYIRQAVLSMLEDMEDVYIAEKRVESAEKVWTQDQLEHGDDLEN